MLIRLKNLRNNHSVSIKNIESKKKGFYEYVLELEEELEPLGSYVIEYSDKQSLHNAGISVVMDVVYGHVSNQDDFSINILTPSYYSRTDSNGSSCGNDTATERLMNRKFIVDSMVYWATEYHIDGFRIDQVGLFDTDTVVALTNALHKIDPAILLYGEGWLMATNTSKDVDLATQINADLTPHFGLSFLNRKDIMMIIISILLLWMKR